MNKILVGARSTNKEKRVESVQHWARKSLVEHNIEQIEKVQRVSARRKKKKKRKGGRGQPSPQKKKERQKLAAACTYLPIYL